MDPYASYTLNCNCNTAADVLVVVEQQHIISYDFTWADEMGLWHHEIIPASLVNLQTMEEGIRMSANRTLLPDPTTARRAILSHPDIIILTCSEVVQKPPRSLKRKELDPTWVDMIPKQFLEKVDNNPSHLAQLLNATLAEDPNYYPGDHQPDRKVLRTSINSSTSFVPWTSFPGFTFDNYSPYASVPTSPSSLPGSPPHSPPNLLSSAPHSPPSLLSSAPHSPTLLSSPAPYSTLLSTSSSFYPVPDSRSPSPTTLSTPPLVSSSPPPSSSPLVSPIASPTRSKRTCEETKSPTSKQISLPLLRPRQVHPTKASKLGLTQPMKKRKNTEHLVCRHCGTTETPEWRRGPDGCKSLCNACGLYYSKLLKKETLVAPQSRRVAIDALLNPPS
eukprot:TRINITY_DN4615_c0_g1_i1.p1 TRINITY_DN4615_c0_g1~~TRINITY_DN4615_c0_g1_i1.p1  ORF type:complete len:390 (+),score=68.56 TRINITY_DN4615_c0_g1_i1:313-1482(+)